MELRVAAWAGVVAFAITGAFLVDQNPYFMAAFAFFAQPLFVIAGLLFLVRVLRDLRERQIL